MTAEEISEDGKITISSETINGDIVLTVKRSENFTISVLEYVAGYSMVLLTETGVRDSDTFRYAYNGKPMYKIEAYKTDNHDVYAYLVQGAVEEADAYAAVTNGTADTKTIPAGNDVNGTGQEDYSDALLAYRCYLIKYASPIAAMEYYLRADVNASKTLNTEDATEIFRTLATS